MDAASTGFLAPDFAAEGAIWPDRSSDAARVLARLDCVRHVHVSGPPGYGKDALALALSRELGPRARIAWLAYDTTNDPEPFSRLARSLGCVPPADASPATIWDAIIHELVSSEVAEPVLLVVGAEHLILSDPDHFEVPEALLASARLVTFSLAPLFPIMPSLGREEAEARTVHLLDFPASADSFDMFERKAQAEADYAADGENWFSAYCARTGAAGDSAALQRVFNLKYTKRIGELWQGHPLVNMAALAGMLDAVRAGQRAEVALDAFRSELASMREGFLYERLLPFRPGATGAVAAAACDSIGSALESWIQAGGRSEALSPEQRAWLVASGLCRIESTSAGPVWTDTIVLVGGTAGALNWARGLQARARGALEEQRKRATRNAIGFRTARDLLERKFDKRLIEFRSHQIIDHDRLYKFRIEEFEPGSAPGKPRTSIGTFDVFVFEDEGGKEFYWQHQIRILSMLGRMRHPALLPFRHGGQLPEPEGNLPHKRVFSYIEIDRPVHLATHDQASRLVNQINPQRASAGLASEPNHAFRQIVQLAEALDLIHAQGIIHRSLDFRALELHSEGGATQLVLTGFEFAANLRSDLSGNSKNVSPREGETSWDFACRAPSWRPLYLDVIDPSLDVYAFGALATMILTGLPETSLRGEVLEYLSGRSAEPGREIAADEAISKVLGELHAELLSEERWARLDPRAAEMAEVLRSCLASDPAQRPPMEDVARHLRARHEEYVASFRRTGEELHISFHVNRMGGMLRHLKLIHEDQDIESGEGKEWLRQRIQEWVGTARWMHFSEVGFPRQGAAQYERTRKESQFVLAGPAVIFFASVFRRDRGTNSEHEDPRILWLTYAVRRNDMLLPDPDDPEQIERRATTEHVSWLPMPGSVTVKLEQEIPELPPTAASWQPTLTELSRRNSSSAQRRLGREAVLAWRAHLNIALTQDRMRNFPVVVERVGNCRYRLNLDLQAFRSMNEHQRNAFLRQTILRGSSERAFFLDTLQQQFDKSGETQLDFLLNAREPGRARSGKRIVGTLVAPVRDDGVEFTVDPSEDRAGVPRTAQMGWFDSIGTEVAANRQAAAIERLQRRTWMMHSLINPADRGRYQWQALQHSRLLLRSASDQDVEEFDETLRSMLSCDPIHAVQGPPGTGKTTLIAGLVAEILSAADGSRILVTSQSHAATDNVLTAVMRALETIESYRADASGGTRPLVALRLFSETTREHVDPAVQRRYSIDAQVREARDRMRASVASGNYTSHVKAREFLNRVAERGYLETRLKLERSSPLIFATTGAALTSLDYLRRGTVGYDFVLIDEAAKAWAIDLVQPLAMADRAIMVGDQNQLPPFGEIELDVLLERARELAKALNKPNAPYAPLDLAELLESTPAADGGESAFERLNGWLRPFHRMFEQKEQARGLDAKKGAVQSLDRQFRSVDAIGSFVSETFYPTIGIRNAGPDPDPTNGRVAIPLRSHAEGIRPAMVWLDTSARTEPSYYSEGGGAAGMFNVGEAQLVCKLLHSQHLSHKRSDFLRVLSPYRRQVLRLRSECERLAEDMGPEAIEQIFQTADSAQGSEADVVVVSMCRRLAMPQANALVSGANKEAHMAEAKRRVNELLGFLQLPQRLNVIFSRPRQQLILVGDFSFYQAGGRLLDEYLALLHDGNAPPSFWQRLLARFAPLQLDNLPTGQGLENAYVIGTQQLWEA
jgi:serine/threonine protein kinase